MSRRSLSRGDRVFDEAIAYVACKQNLHAGFCFGGGRKTRRPINSEGIKTQFNRHILSESRSEGDRRRLTLARALNRFERNAKPFARDVRGGLDENFVGLLAPLGSLRDSEKKR